MKSLKKALRMVCFVLFLILAAFCLGFSGAIFAPVNQKQENAPVKIELVEDGSEDSRASDDENKP
jgi:hypothetical protein